MRTLELERPSTRVPRSNSCAPVGRRFGRHSERGQHDGRGHGSRHGQSGFGLIETVVAVALAAMLVLGLTAGLLFLFRTNSSVKQDQQLQRVLGNLSESIKAAEYLSCEGRGAGEVTPAPSPPQPTPDSATFVQDYTRAISEGAAAVLQPAGTGPSGQPVFEPTDDWRTVDDITVEVVKVQFWQKVTFAASPVAPAPAPAAAPSPGAGSFRADCPFELTTSGAVVLDGGAPKVIDDGAQLITLRARLGDRSATAQVLKADRRPLPTPAGPG